MIEKCHRYKRVFTSHISCRYFANVFLRQHASTAGVPVRTPRPRKHSESLHDALMCTRTISATGLSMSIYICDFLHLGLVASLCQSLFDASEKMIEIAALLVVDDGDAHVSDSEVFILDLFV